MSSWSAGSMFLTHPKYMHTDNKERYNIMSVIKTVNKIHRMINTISKLAEGHACNFYCDTIYPVSVEGWHLWILHIDLHIHSNTHLSRIVSQNDLSTIISLLLLSVFHIAHILVYSQYAVNLEISRLLHIHKLKEYFKILDLKCTCLNVLALSRPFEN